MLTTDQADLDVGKERAAQRVGEVEHLGIVVATVEECADAEQDGLTHRKKRHDDLRNEARITVSRLLQDDQVAGDTFQALDKGARSRGGAQKTCARAV